MRILFALLILVFSGCATTTTEYFKGCVDGVEALKFQLRTPEIANQDIAEYFCKVVERNRKQKEIVPHEKN
ncbi:MAG: hypothetical protein OIN85_00885 [Candidatus Methanoperedens sp.]|nr:hypothetical protein [Candidatus Methanoperedens sp.]